MNIVLELGFDMTQVTVSEGDGTAQVGVVVFQPDPSLVSSAFGEEVATAVYNLETIDNSAIGMNLILIISVLYFIVFWSI